MICTYICQLKCSLFLLQWKSNSQDSIYSWGNKNMVNIVILYLTESTLDQSYWSKKLQLVFNRNIYTGASYFVSYTNSIPCMPCQSTWKIGQNWWNTVDIVKIICHNCKMSARFWNEKLASSYDRWLDICRPEISYPAWHFVCSIVPSTFVIRRIHFIRPNQIVVTSYSVTCRSWPILALHNSHRKLA